MITNEIIIKPNQFEEFVELITPEILKNKNLEKEFLKDKTETECMMYEIVKSGNENDVFMHMIEQIKIFSDKGIDFVLELNQDEYDKENIEIPTFKDKELLIELLKAHGKHNKKDFIYYKQVIKNNAIFLYDKEEKSYYKMNDFNKGISIIFEIYNKKNKIKEVLLNNTYVVELNKSLKEKYIKELTEQ